MSPAPGDIAAEIGSRGARAEENGSRGIETTDPGDTLWCVAGEPCKMREAGSNLPPDVLIVLSPPTDTLNPKAPTAAGAAAV
mmetsp:Transcript_25404/g.71405  ORF Transcript_25404/g.71405 Transcript_25404/m.71405 type:complete len:82 (+) Transcript_25404:294-539(+)